MASWLFNIIRQIIAWILGTAAVLLLVPVVFFLAACFVVNRPTAERYMRGLSGAWRRDRR